MAKAQDTILPLLRDMRADNERRHSEVISRLAKLEAAQTSFKQALGADSLLSKLATGEFEGRIAALERKVRELEIQK